MSSSPQLALFLALAVVAGSMARATENGYLGLSIGSARADFTAGTSAASSQIQFRFSGARQFSALTGLEMGVSYARGFDPAPDIAARVPGSHIKVVLVDASGLLFLPLGSASRLFIAAGPAMTSARVEVSATEGGSTQIVTHRDFTVRASAGIDYMRTHSAVRLAWEHLPSIGDDSGPGSPGRSSMDTVSLGILLRL